MHAKAPTTAQDALQRASSACSNPDAPPTIEACAIQVRRQLDQKRTVLLACDPSPEGVLAAVGVSYLAHAHENDVRLASARSLQPRLGEELVYVPSDGTEDTVAFVRRVMRGFSTKVTAGCRKRKAGGCSPTCDNACVRRLVYATASDDDNMPEVVYRYLRLGFAVGSRVRQLIAQPQVVAFNDLARYVLCECEHTRQFVRFSHMADGSYAASFSAKANTIPLTAGHFAARMRTERFFLVDPLHQVAAFHRPAQPRCQILRIDATIAQELATRTDFAEDEAYVRALWQHFYQGTTTPGRDRSQRGYDLRTHWMPQRFWSGLSELEPQADPERLVVPERYSGHKHTHLSSSSPTCMQAGLPDVKAL